LKWLLKKFFVREATKLRGEKELNEKVTVSRMKRHLRSEEIEVFNSQRGKRKVTKSRVTYTALSNFKPKHNEKGQRLCLNCGKIIEDKRRRKYCSEDCSHQWFRKHYWVGMRDYILKIQKYTCQKCGATPPREENGMLKWTNDHSRLDYFDYVVDHKIPIALGGDEFDEDNLQVLCGICDKEKTEVDQAKITKLNKECKLTCLSNSFEVPFKEFYDLEKQAKLFSVCVK